MRGFLLSLVLTVTATAGTIEDSIPDARYLAYGEGYAPYTRKLVTIDPSGKTPTGTCVLIAPHWCLTAAHVVDNAAVVMVEMPDGPRMCDRFFIHSEYVPSRYSWDDIALVHVTRPFGLKRYPPLSDGEEAVGAVVAVAGYGVTGPLSTGHERGDGRLRAGTCVITGFDGGSILCKARRDGSPLPICIAPGDSGGPMFVGGRLAGIASFTRRDGTGPTRSKVGEESGHIRISLYRSWIREVAGELDESCMLAGCESD